jgi:uroporphyrinogen-III synthase
VLAGRTVGVLRARHQAAGIAAKLEAAGATVLTYPVIAIVPPDSYAPLDEALSPAARYDWVVFTSVNAADAVASRLATGQCVLPAGARIAAIGEVTAAAVRRLGRQATVVAPRPSAPSLAAALPVGPGARVLLPLGSLAGDALSRGLRDRGAIVEVVAAYRTVPDDGGIAALGERLPGPGLDVLLLTSGSTVRFLLDGLPPARRALLTDPPARPALVSIGPATTAVARGLGLAVESTATSPTDEGLLDAVRSCFAPAS